MALWTTNVLRMSINLRKKKKKNIKMLCADMKFLKELEIITAHQGGARIERVTRVEFLMLQDLGLSLDSFKMLCT